MSGLIDADAQLDGLIACHKCDVLHEISHINEGEKACCRQCGAVLIHSGESAFLRVITLALTVLILMLGAIFFPFLRLQAGQIEHHSSVFDAITAFSSGLMLPLSFAVAALIVFIPVARVVAIIYTLWPLMRGQPAYRHAPRGKADTSDAVIESTKVSALRLISRAFCKAPRIPVTTISSNASILVLSSSGLESCAYIGCIAECPIIMVETITASFVRLKIGFLHGFFILGTPPLGIFL